jgi:hypothetical protein
MVTQRVQKEAYESSPGIRYAKEIRYLLALHNQSLNTELLHVLV